MGTSLLVASVAGSVNVMLTNPIWLAVTRLQTQGSSQQRKTFAHVFRELYAEDGLRGLWRVCLCPMPTLLVFLPTVRDCAGRLLEWCCRC